MLVSYNWLKKYITDIPSEDEVARLITFHVCELESQEKLPNGDTIFDIKILPDRAHDLLSHYGVAFEISGLLGLEMKENSSHNSFQEVLGRGEWKPERDLEEKNSASEFLNKENPASSLQIKIESPNCRRYMGRIVRGVEVGPSPEWMKALLESIGQRSINNIVDATNYVLFDIGQPIHTFDLDKLSSPTIVVRNAKNGEKISLVGQEKLEAELRDEDLMITDDIDNLAIAGIKGGLSSGISENTKNILIEVANFAPVSTRKTSRRLAILSDASKRYENDLPIVLSDKAMNEISLLIKEMCPSASFEDVVDVWNISEEKQKEKRVSFTTSYISKMLGVKIKDEEIDKILRNYHYGFRHHGEEWDVIIPSTRLDISGPHDFVEEIGRVYGYEKITSHIPHIREKKDDHLTWKKICIAKRKLINDGYREVMTYAFCKKGKVEVLASASDKNFLRTNLSDGLSESIKLNQKNLPVLSLDEVKVFEIGTVFTDTGEEMRVAFGDKKKIEELSLDKFINEIMPDLNSPLMEDYLVSISSSSLIDNDPLTHKDDTSRSIAIPIFKSWSVYPFITRDIAVWIPEEIKPEALVKIYKDFGTELLITEPRLFDSFTKEGRTSYAYRLVFQAVDRTLTDEEINGIMTKITDKISSLGWQVR